VIVDEPPWAVTVTFRPETGLPEPSKRRTVTVAAVDPSAGTLE